jgi:formamidase
MTNASQVIRAHIHIDRDVPLASQPHKGHNRWHPDIPPAVHISPGSFVELETLDAVDGQIRPGTKADDLAVDLNRAHPLTGPVYVEGAEPGDLLAVKIQQIVTADRGFTAILPGFGFLRDLFLKPFLVHWELANGYALSEDLPGVRIPGAPFMGVMGVAPSHELMERITAREAELMNRGGMVLPPEPSAAVPAGELIASSAPRTIAPHENGGNLDIKQLIAGSTLYLPVYVPGALFSVGDTHFAQGDGESCGTAIETSSTFVAQLELLKGEARRRHQIGPAFSYSAPQTAANRRFYATTGISVRKDGRNESEDLNVAARNALLNMIDYIVDAHGYTREQAYCLTSVAVNLRVSQVVDVPNLVVSAFLPLDIFRN